MKRDSGAVGLRKQLGRYTEATCPDYLYEAWCILFKDANPLDWREILDQAFFDLEEAEKHRSQTVFNRDRRHMEGAEKAKFNWSTK